MKTKIYLKQNRLSFYPISEKINANQGFLKQMFKDTRVNPQLFKTIKKDAIKLNIEYTKETKVKDLMIIKNWIINKNI